MRARIRNRATRAFTLVEILIVVVILGILAAIVIPQFTNASQEATAASIESQLHWVLDVTFSEDASRIRKQRAPQTSAMLRRLAVSILSADTSLNDTLRGKRYRACLNANTLERILLGFAAN